MLGPLIPGLVPASKDGAESGLPALRPLRPALKPLEPALKPLELALRPLGLALRLLGAVLRPLGLLGAVLRPLGLGLRLGSPSWVGVGVLRFRDARPAAPKLGGGGLVRPEEEKPGPDRPWEARP
ncbi:hypothetical protein GCM10009828_054940 [Actinoplanes couchii]|uniref:Uncharacterized protein n=1 Tax=Actinoplanes couchii TaxID=403638 RepID=A0ABQ3X0T5_9ACTN|nr:hypothetical protein Aco03nite_005110 [Actinoplanes couchii]